AAARAVHVDEATGAPWGGWLPGVLAVSSTRVDALRWWRGQLDEVATSAGDRPVARLWHDLPAAVVAAVTDPSQRISAVTLGEVPVEPATLVDLDGFDPARPWWFAPAGEQPRRYVSDTPGLRTLLHDAADALRAHGWHETVEPAAVPGIVETPALRRWFRSCCAEDAVPPNPYVVGEVADFVELLRTEDPDGVTGISRHADQVVEQRPDLEQAFGSVRWSGRDHLVRWMWSHGLAEGQTSLALLPDLPVPPDDRTTDDGSIQGRSTEGRSSGGPRPFGVNLVGYLTGDLGLGVAARRMHAALDAAGIPVATVTYDRTSSRRSGPSQRSLDAPYSVNLLVITPDQLPYFVEDVGPGFFEGRHNIGLWYWETNVLTERQRSSFQWVDEVWGATRYLVDVFAAEDRVPVHLVPVPLVFEDPQVTPEDRERLGLDDRFTVLFSFDFLSVVERKNPLGLIDAFCRAFGPDDGARLILKGINGDVFPDEREQLIDAAAGRDDIEVWDTYLSSRDRLALVAAVDCYASLHRSEGLGLTMAEAMALGTPVVATAYSGNLDFMDDDSALLVPATEILIGPGHLYPAEGSWADPDLDVAAAQLRRLHDDPALRARLAEAGPRALAPHGVESVGDVVSQRLGAGGSTP
ncbi:MAG: glycosyltransferase family 4 protein, partial [Actinomycetota bacterium]|nr:glycosyltransferase family 4 protein [Actinomycetota bacterium]